MTRLRAVCVCGVLLLSAVGAAANDLSVDRRTVRVDEPVTIIVSLEDAFAKVDEINLPVKNLQIDGAPSVSSQISLINGTFTRRKIFRFVAHPLSPGPALVGPLVVEGDRGEHQTLAPVSLQVIPDTASGSNDPLTTLRELLATNRDPFFIITDVEKKSAIAGEEVVVTWMLYNAASVQRWQIARVPKLEDFWTEELDVRNEAPQRVMVGDLMMERMPVRRVALFPLRSGTLSIGSMEAEAAILRRTGDSPLGFFEGTMVEVRVPSSAVTLDVKPLPAGVVPDVIGDVSMDCGAVSQKAGGPVTLTVGLRGRANLRAAAAPRFNGPVDGEVVSEPLPVDVTRTRDSVMMARSWRYLIFPRTSGVMRIPALALNAFNPASSSVQQLRCTAATLNVQETAAPSAGRSAVARPLLPASPRRLWPWAGAVALVIVFGAAVLPRFRRGASVRRVSRDIARGASATQIRERAASLLAARGVDAGALVVEASDRGDAWRALTSLLDAIERDRIVAESASDEVELRVRDLVQSLG